MDGAHQKVSPFYKLNHKMELVQLIYSCDLEGIQKLIESNPEIVNTPDERGFTPLILATYLNKMEVAELFINHGAQINAQDASGNTALMGVCFKGYPELAKMLLDNGADATIKNHKGDTAISFARTHGHDAIEQLMV